MTRVRMLAVAVALLTVAGMGALAPAEEVEATWSDPEVVTTNVTAGFVAAATKSGTCSIGLLGLSVTVNWNAPSSGVTPTGYRVEILSPTGTLEYSTTLAATTTTWTGTGLLSSLLASGTHTLRIMPVAYEWRGPAMEGSITANLLLGLITGCTW